MRGQFYDILVRIGAFLDKIRKSLRDVGDIVDGADDVVRYVRRWFFFTNKDNFKDVELHTVQAYTTFFGIC